MVDKSVFIKKEPLFESEITQDEWQELFDDEPTLQYSSKPYEYFYKCEISLFASNKISGFDFDLAKDILDKLFSDIKEDNLILGKENNNRSSYWNPIWHAHIINKQ